MTWHDEPDDILAAWLDEGPRDLPSTTRRAITTSLTTTRQTRRGHLAPRRLFAMSMLTRAAFALAAVAVAIAGAAVILREPSGPAGPTPTLSPSPSTPPQSPTPTEATQGSQAPAAWPTYTSPQHRFTIGYPADWTLRKAYRPWSIEEDLNDGQLTAGADGFLSPDENLYVNAWMAPLSDLSGDEWLSLFCPTCPDLPTRPVEVDGVPGILVTGPNESLAYVFLDDRVYAFGIWRDGYEPLFEEFLSTVRLP